MTFAVNAGIIEREGKFIIFIFWVAVERFYEINKRV